MKSLSPVSARTQKPIERSVNPSLMESLIGCHSNRKATHRTLSQLPSPSSHLLFPNPFVIFHESLSSLEVAQLLLNQVVLRVSERPTWLFPLRDIRLLLVCWEHSQSRHGWESHREHGSFAHRPHAISPFSMKERAQCPRGSDVDCFLPSESSGMSASHPGVICQSLTPIAHQES